MAQNLQHLKRRIKTANNVSQIAKAMEMMSASKIKRAQTTVENNKPHAERVAGLTSALIKRVDRNEFRHSYIDGNKSKKKLLIVISTDKGLCGSLNTNLFKKLIELEDPNTLLVAVGGKSERIAARLSFEFTASFKLGTTIPKYNFVIELASLVNDLYSDSTVGSVEILYTEFISFFQQTPIIKRLLPINTGSEDLSLNIQDAVFEPSAGVILESLLPHYLEVQIYNSLIQAYTSEQAARMVAMQNAKNNANDIASFLTLTYNKTRQERITSEILDLSNSQT